MLVQALAENFDVKAGKDGSFTLKPVKSRSPSKSPLKSPPKSPLKEKSPERKMIREPLFTNSQKIMRKDNSPVKTSADLQVIELRQVKSI